MKQNHSIAVTLDDAPFAVKQQLTRRSAAKAPMPSLPGQKKICAFEMRALAIAWPRNKSAVFFPSKPAVTICWAKQLENN